MLDGGWGGGYDLVIFSANAFYELSDVSQQERCIELARETLVPDGYIFIDNDDYKGDWENGPFGVERVVFEGQGLDGTYGRFSMISKGFDTKKGVLSLKRIWLTRTTSSIESRVEYLGKKHPVSRQEVQSWLTKHHFLIKNVFGDRNGNPYNPQSERAIFWATKI